jgi:hypothetical protein
MKIQSNPMKQNSLIAATFAVIAILSPARATLLVYEGFNGYSTGSLVGQTASSSTIGLTGNYQSVGGTSLSAVSSGLTLGNLVVSGGAANSSSQTAAAIGVAFSNSVSATGTIYSSYLAQINTSPTSPNDSALYMGIGSSPTGTNATRTFKSYGVSGSGANTPGIAYGATDIMSPSPALSLNTTYAIVARYTRVGSTLSVGSPGVATLWVLTADQFNYFSIGGFSDAELDAATVGSGATNVYNTLTQTVTSGSYTFDNTKALQFSTTAANGASSFYMDEIRWGTSLNDVLPIPEPQVVVLLAISAGLLLVSRKRREAKMVP